MRNAVLAALLVIAACGDSSAPPQASPSAPMSPTPAPTSSMVAVNRGELKEVGEASGIQCVLRSGGDLLRHVVDVKGLGVATADFDGDGRVDVLVTSGSSLERFNAGESGYGIWLYRNVTAAGGAIAFEEIPNAGGISGPKWPSGPAVVDIDGDGDLDVLLTGFGGMALWRNRGNGTFEDATKSSGLDLNGWTTGAAFADLDGDGDLDLYIARYLTLDPKNPPVHGSKYSCTWKGHVVLCGPRGLPAEADRAFRNQGDGTFEDATAAWGFDKAEAQYGLGVLARDFNGDGKVDVFVANDSCANFLFINNGSTFDEVALESGVAYSEDGKEMAGMGVDASDLNGDGLPDIIVTNFSDQPNSIFLSQSRGRWLESSRSTGVALPSYPMLSWGVAFADMDCDGREDFLVANGHVYPEADRSGTDTSFKQPAQLFLRVGPSNPPRFADVSSQVGASFAVPHVARALAVADLDLDGDSDAVMVAIGERPQVFENRLTRTGQPLRVRLRDLKSRNREAIGGLVTLAVTRDVQSRAVRRNHSFFASSDGDVMLSIPSGTATAELLVAWPDGSTEVFTWTAGKTHVILERGTGRSR